MPLVAEEIPAEVAKKETLVPAHSSPYYDQVPVIDEVLVKAYEVPKTDLGAFVIKETTPVAVVEEKDSEKERAKHVAEEAVKCVEAKRNSRDSACNSREAYNSYDSGSRSQMDSAPHSDYSVLEILHKEREVANVPLEQGGSRSEQEEIDEATRQLDDAIDDIDIETTVSHFVGVDDANIIQTQEESAVVLEESAVSEFATVSLALDEDISAIETTHLAATKEIQVPYLGIRFLIPHPCQKLHYTQPLSPHPVDAFPSQTHYVKLK